MLILTFNDNEEKAVEKVLAALADEIKFEVLQSFPLPCYPIRGSKYGSTNGVCFGMVKT